MSSVVGIALRGFGKALKKDVSAIKSVKPTGGTTKSDEIKRVNRSKKSYQKLKEQATSNYKKAKKLSYNQVIERKDVIPIAKNLRSLRKNVREADKRAKDTLKK